MKMNQNWGVWGHIRTIANIVVLDFLCNYVQGPHIDSNPRVEGPRV